MPVLRPGVGGIVGAFEALGGNVGIDLSGGEMGVAEKLLNAAQVGPGIQQMSGITVAQLVGREMRVQTRQRQVFFKTELNGTRGNGSELLGAGTKNGRFTARWLRQ